MRLGEFDVLVGINLLREGLDLPEVSLVAILDADKEGFLRNHRSLIQTIGRAARNAEGEVIMYADVMTDSMSRAIKETERRRRSRSPSTKSMASFPPLSAKVSMTSPISWVAMTNEALKRSIVSLRTSLVVRSCALSPIWKTR